MPAIINAGTGGDLAPGLDGSGGPVATAIGVVRNISLTCSLGDVLSAQVSYGWDQVSGEARIILPFQSGSIGDSVSVTMGAGNSVQRFAGKLVSFETTLAPRSVTALCKGPLYVLEEYENPTETINAGDGSGRPGLAFEDLVGASSATLKQTVSAVLARVGVTYSSGNLQDPAHVYGLLAPEEFTWGTHETAAAYLHRLLEASAGYRLFDSADGNVYLQQISAIPSGTVDFTLTLGEDIFADSQSVSSKIGQRTGVVVEGYDDGSGPAVGTAGDTSLPFRVFSNLIETDAFAAELAAFWLPQVNRLQEVVRLHTPVDGLFGPGQTHHIDLGNALNDTLWLKSVMTEITPNGEFSQHSVYVASA